jgi:hypothetical protein
MSADFLHNHLEFPELIRIVAQQWGIDPALIEKDYWIMHCLYGLQQLELTFGSQKRFAPAASRKSNATPPSTTRR